MNTLNREKPFEYLRRMADGTPFDPEIVKSWYVARTFVLQKLSNKSRCFNPSENKHLHVVIDGDSTLMLCVARHVALYAHYLNYQEEEVDEALRNRTVISIVSTDPLIKQKLNQEEFLCNLPAYCKFVDADGGVENKDSFIDIEIHAISRNIYQPDQYTLIFTESEFFSFYDNARNDESVLTIDTSKAYYASQSYALGVEIDNLPSEDIHCAERYSRALDIFQDKVIGPFWHKPRKLATDQQWEAMSLCQVKEKISNIFCSDSFAIRNASLSLCGNPEDPKLWQKYFNELSGSEHARWVVEKLILGYRPFSREERDRDILLTVKYAYKGERSNYRRKLKRNNHSPAHIDICSCADLRRVDPDNRRYDSFLMLAIPMILGKVREKY
ncbi:MAG: hypothetical protein IJ618_10575 [Prevotella sp.]|nr:hypothetical protein [Prevotella sp.]